MRIWSSRLLFWNFVILVALKGVAPSSAQLASIVLGEQTFAPQEIVTHTNARRTAVGLPPLTVSATLNVVAAQKLDDMVRNQYFAHFSPSGVSPWHWFKVNGYTYAYAGENLAIGFPTAPATVAAWMDSPSHRNNILNEAFREIGVAVAWNSIGPDAGVVVVQMFGTPTSVPITLSRSAADQQSPSPVPSQSILPSISPPTTKSPPTKLAQVSPVPQVSSAPRVTTIENRSFISSLVRILNSTFSFYAYGLVIAALGYFWFRGFRRELLPRLALHILIFFLATSVPLITASTFGRIG